MLARLVAVGFSVGVLLIASGCRSGAAPASSPEMSPPERIFSPLPEEKHLGDIRMLTDGGENAEAYFSYNGRKLTFQSTRPPYGCDQIFTMKTDGTGLKLVSTGKGRTTCSYFLPGDKRILYASTHKAADACPAPADMSKGYVWKIYPEFDIFTANADGSDVIPLTNTPGYDAEATISPKGDRIVFTSTRDGDLDLYSMKLDGTDVRRLTDALGYDGGAFFSPDGQKIVFRAQHPTDPKEVEDYKALLAQDLVRPTRLDIWIMNADGSNKQRVTNLDVASFAPYFHPSGKKIIFSSNHPNVKSREFDLWMVDLDGKNLERITYGPGFDGFPMFSPDGKKLVFCSNRNNSKPGETNVFITDWKD